MSEGKLKRDIQRQFLSNHWSQTQDIFPILDKAKVDFPRVIFPDDAGPEYFQTAKEELVAIQKWVLKWFGDFK
jgi:hypothetical protein